MCYQDLHCISHLCVSYVFLLIWTNQHDTCGMWQDVKKVRSIHSMLSSRRVKIVLGKTLNVFIVSSL